MLLTEDIPDGRSALDNQPSRGPLSLLELVYPFRCPICGTTTDLGRLPWCDVCAERVHLWTQSVCPHCRRFRAADFADCDAGHPQAEPRFVAALGAYDEAMRAVIGALKYESARRLARLLAGLLAERLTGRAVFDVVVSVPTSARKKRKMGYGHAEEIATHLAHALKVPFCSDGLYQTRRIADQTRLTAEKRRANLAGAFAVEERTDFKGKNVLLVDDVMTTGATMEEATRVLMAAEPRHVAVAIAALNLSGV